VHFPGVSYQIFAALLIASILAPIFLYPAFRAASRLKVAYATIREQAFTDHLTQLPNSLALMNELETRIDRGHPQFAVHILDLNRFKDVNDGLGLDAGDALLVAVADTLRTAIRPDDFVARFGTDQFVVIQEGAKGAPDASQYAAELLDAISSRYDVLGHQVVTKATAGTALVPQHGTRAKQIVGAADFALSKSKATSVAWSLFETDLAKAATSRRDIEVGLRAAVKAGELRLAYQPIVRAGDPTDVVAVEALLRWQTSAGDQVPPAEFIPVAESSDLIVELGAWALREACREAAGWSPAVRISVNVSPAQFQHGNFVEIVEAILSETGLAPDRLELEITETMLISDTNFFAPALTRLRQMGVRIALDDFGSGFCGLNYLRRFKIDKIKVDKSIIDEAVVDERAANILRGVSKIAGEIGMIVTIEGVDSLEKADLIRRENCADELQGFFFSRPLPADGIRRMIDDLRAQRALSSKVVPLERHSSKAKLQS
jgi:diguanylate cyclase (GGDEF)-like protein